MVRSWLKISVLFLLFSAFLQTTKLVHWEAQLNKLESEYFVSMQETRRLSTLVDSLGIAISSAKSRSGFLNDRNLAQLLARSHEVANKLTLSRDLSHERLNALTAASSTLLDTLQVFSTQLSSDLLVAEKQRDRAAQTRLIQDIQQTRLLMQHCRTYSSDTAIFDGLLRVTTDSTDTPESLRQKSDFILDQADRLRRQAEKLQTKRESLRAELSMRGRISDFFGDLALTDPQREVTASDQGRSQEEIKYNSDVAGMEAGRNQASEISLLPEFFRAGSNLPEDKAWFSNIENLESGEIEKWLEVLDHQRLQWLNQADSLDNQARILQQSIQNREDKF
ncbi:MAG: hypothetical protein H6696_09180 [Deferribacteres bacterium]|nr:hypothetical protein [Deferribacteres bacterium]